MILYQLAIIFFPPAAALFMAFLFWLGGHDFDKREPANAVILGAAVIIYLAALALCIDRYAEYKKNLK